MRRILLGLVLLPYSGLATIRYRLTPDPAAKSLTIAVHLDTASAQPKFSIPAWTPGFYFLQKYEKEISNVKAFDAQGQPLTVSHPHDRTWEIENPTKKAVTFSYRVLGDDKGLGFFGVNVRAKTAFINGPAAFVYPDDRLKEDTTLEVNLPKAWDIATPMDKDDEGRYTAAGYDELADNPIEMGSFVRKKFDVNGIPFEAVFTAPDGDVRCNPDMEAAKLQTGSKPALRLFGSAPFKRYIYFIHLAVGDFNGGLEHRACNVVATQNSTDLGLDDLETHEYFHAWNVKQIRPEVLGPFDYTREVRTTNLWFAEGVTDYYSKLHAFQSGLKDETWLADQLADQIRTLQLSRMRRIKTLEETSRQAWENGGFGVGDLSYYNKGLVAGLVFDAAIRDATDGARSLDDVLRLLMARHKIPKPGYGENEILTTINEVAGKDLTKLYDSIVRSTDEVPYELLAGIGLRVLLTGHDYPELAFQCRNQKIVSVPDSSEFHVGDEVVSVEAPTNLMSAVVVRRNGEEIRIEAPIQMVQSDGFRVERDPFASDRARKNLAAWLKGSHPVEK